MKTMLLSALAASGLLLIAVPTASQAQVTADIRIGIPPARGRVVVVRPEHRVVVVERAHRSPRGGWRHSGYREVRLWFYRGSYYDRWTGPIYPEMRQVVVYQRDGRYYRDWDDRDNRWDRNRDGDRDDRGRWGDRDDRRDDRGRNGHGGEGRGHGDREGRGR